MLETLRKSLEEKWYIRIRLKQPENDHYDGIVTHIGRSVVVLAQIDDFRLDGYRIIPKKYIKSCRDRENESCANAILDMHKVKGQVKPPKWTYQCESMRDVLLQVERRGIWPGLEEIIDNQSAFYIGPVRCSGAREFEMLCYDAAGKWEKWYALEFSDVCGVVVKDNYTERFNSFMRKTNPPPSVLS